MTKIAIHQPNFIPWPGYFYKIEQADIFILYDTAEFTKNSFINRNKILVNNMEKWLTIPVIYKGYSRSSIKNIRLNPDSFRPEKIIKTIAQEYRKYPHFEEFMSGFAKILDSAKTDSNLSNLNEELIRWMCGILEIHTNIIRASTLNVPESNTTDSLIAMCKACGATIYLSGKSGKKYLKEGLFEKEGIELLYSEFSMPETSNPSLSSLHWLFLEGRNLKSFLK